MNVDIVDHFRGHEREFVVQLESFALIELFHVVNLDCRQIHLFNDRPNPPEIGEHAIEFAVQHQHAVVRVVLDSVHQELVIPHFDFQF